jgi:hypothetical protein
MGPKIPTIMLNFELMNRIRLRLTIASFLLLFLGSCDLIVSEEPNAEAVARVGRYVLYRSDLPDFSYLADSLSIISAEYNFIESWAAKRLSLENSLNYLSESDQWELDRMVENYRIELYSQAYYNTVATIGKDTLVEEEALRDLYEKEKSSLLLDEDLIKLRFIALSSSYTKPDEIEERFKRFNQEDRLFIDSLNSHNYLTEVYLNDSLWVRSSSIIERIRPLTYQNAKSYLKPYQFFSLQDSIGYYYGQVLDTRKKGDIAPFTFAEIELQQILDNRNQFDRIDNIQKQLLKDALRKGDFEIFR